jgi:hypothetical protein
LAAAAAHRDVAGGGGFAAGVGSNGENAQRPGSFRRAAFGATDLVLAGHGAGKVIELFVAGLTGVFVNGHRKSFMSETINLATLYTEQLLGKI